MREDLMYVDALIHGGSIVVGYAWTPETGGALVSGRDDVRPDDGGPSGTTFVCPDAVVGTLFDCDEFEPVETITRCGLDVDVGRRLDAHVEACRVVGMDVRTPGALPDRLMLDYFGRRRGRALDGRAATTDGQRTVYVGRPSGRPSTADVDRVLASATVRGIRVDVSRVVPHGHGDLTFVAGVRRHLVDGRVHPRYDVWGGRTGRIGIVPGSFNPMSIPRSGSRLAVVPTVPGGSIVSLDVNAVDFRCLVGLTGDRALVDLYRGRRDFHTRTCELVLGSSDGRDVVKSLVYPWLYGSSVGSAAVAAGMSTDDVVAVFSRMSDVLRSLVSLRTRVRREMFVDGVLRTPWRDVPVRGDVHDGMLVGLLAQSASSEAFRAMLAAVGRLAGRLKGGFIFPVHDELVFDVHPDDLRLLPEVVRSVESAADVVLDVGFVVRARKGGSYGELEDIDV